MAKTNLGNLAPYALTGLIGALLGAALASILLTQKAGELMQANIEFQKRIQVLGEKLVEQTDNASSLADQPADKNEPFAAEQKTAQQTQPQKPPSPPKGRSSYGKISQEPQAQSHAEPPMRPLPQQSPAQLEPPMQRLPQEPPSQPHSEPQMKRLPVEGKKIEAISNEKAGVGKIEKGAITLANGHRVRIGEKFPSGEELLFIDAKNQHIVTNTRQILLMN